MTRGTGTPKDRDEINKREVCECDGFVCDLDATGAPSISNYTHRLDWVVYYESLNRERQKLHMNFGVMKD